jgi:hypothetical protein
MMALSPVAGTFLWAWGSSAGVDDPGASIPAGHKLSTVKLSIMDLRVTQDFSGGIAMQLMAWSAKFKGRHIVPQSLAKPMQAKRFSQKLVCSKKKLRMNFIF